MALDTEKRSDAEPTTFIVMNNGNSASGYSISSHEYAALIAARVNISVVMLKLAANARVLTLPSLRKLKIRKMRMRERKTGMSSQ